MHDPRASAASDPFAFVIGCPRSGTTMLRAMLDSHPSMAVPPESYFVVPALRRAWRFEADGRVDPDALAAELARHRSFSDWRIGLDDCVARWRATAPATVADAIVDLYGLYAARRGKSQAADKTPFHVLHLELLASRFTGARFLHIVRDGRDVVPSLLEMRFGPERFGEAVLFWERRVASGRSAGRGLGPSRYHEVRYETLVARPEATLREICAFFDLEFAPEMLEYHRRADAVLDGMRNVAHHAAIRRPPTANLRDWRATMAPGRVQLFEAIAGDLLDDLGYARSELPPTGRARVGAVAWRTADRLDARTWKLRDRVARRLRPATVPAGRGAAA